MLIEEILPLDDLWQDTRGWRPDRAQQELFQRMYAEILAANKQLNLTRITEPREFLEKHIWDSIIPIFFLESSENLINKKIIDIGTGAGFPGIPVAITFPDCQVTLLDSTSKKINFIANLITNLHIDNVTTLLGRAEVIGRDNLHREKYDLALIRAVSRTSVCAEYALPLVKKDGFCILYRGNLTGKETEKLALAVEILGGEIEKIKQFITPLTHNIRHCIYLKKISNTPERFPRKIGQPAKKPL